MTVTVRFAPSPTGYIHIGNTRTALSNWLFAQKNGGKFILRYDDTDVERSREEYAQAIAVDLDWLGIKPDRVEYQSKRFDVYGKAVEKLKQAGLLYACYETADELERRRKLRLARRLPPVYGREGLKLTEDERAAFEAEGRKPHWRFLLPNFETDPFDTKRTEVHWDDLVRGPQTVDLASMSDPVLVREDGTYLYTLPSVVDDIDLGVTHIIRGDDHVTNTGVQIAIFEALGLPLQFWTSQFADDNFGRRAFKTNRRSVCRFTARSWLRAHGCRIAGDSDWYIGKCIGCAQYGKPGRTLRSGFHIKVIGKV